MWPAVAYHILNVDRPKCILTCSRGQIICTDADGGNKTSIPMEDVASIVITSFLATLSTALLAAAAKHGVSIVVCEAYQPVSIVLPANRSTDTLLTRAHLKIKARARASLWQRTVNAKVRNQILLGAHLAPRHANLDKMAEILASRSEHKEAIAARLYWSVYGESIGLPNFVRYQNLGGINALLNYGYAILLSIVLQKLFAVGLDPTFGIFHVSREHATPLAYDLMEPFRPCVDSRVAEWSIIARRKPDPLEVDRPFRQWITEFAIRRISYLNRTMELRSAVEEVVRSFRRAVMEQKPSLYLPWTPKASKWDGSW